MRRKDLDYDLIRRVLGQWQQYAAYYFGDYYPLTPYSLDPTLWMAWQFDVPEKGEGMVQAFRRDESVYEAARFKLRGLDPGARYTVTNLDSGESQTLTGRELLEKGLAVAITDQPGSAVITYAKLLSKAMSFALQWPGRIVFGAESLASLGEEIKALGAHVFRDHNPGPRPARFDGPCPIRFERGRSQGCMLRGG